MAAPDLKSILYVKRAVVLFESIERLHLFGSSQRHSTIWTCPSEHLTAVRDTKQLAGQDVLFLGPVELEAIAWCDGLKGK